MLPLPSLLPMLSLQVNNPPCATCGSSSTQLSGMGAPTPQEQPHAGRVEVYNCTVCSQVCAMQDIGGGRREAKRQNKQGV